MIDSVLAIYKALPALTLSVQGLSKRAVSPANGFDRLNLRGNRIHSLCGLERLLSLQELDLRSNEIYDVSELSRLVVLPHLRKLYVSDGWRIELFNAFLQDPCHGRRMEDLPDIDGFAPSWNERRYLIEPSSSGFITSHPPVNGQRANSRHERDTAAEPAHMVVSPRKVRQPSTASVASKRTSTGSAFLSRSPPPPVPMLPTDHQSAPLSPARIDSDDSSARAVKPKVVKKKHRRVVDLDGPKNNPPAQIRQHDRSVSSPGWAEEQTGSSATGKAYHTMSSMPSATSKSRGAGRKLSDSTFAPPPAADVASGSGSEVEEFRKKMEQLRDEVGAENWLSVYASQGNNTAQKK